MYKWKYKYIFLNSWDSLSLGKRYTQLLLWAECVTSFTLYMGLMLLNSVGLLPLMKLFLSLIVYKICPHSFLYPIYSYNVSCILGRQVLLTAGIWVKLLTFFSKYFFFHCDCKLLKLQLENPSYYYETWSLISLRWV